MDKIPFEDGVKLKNATVTIQEQEYEVIPAKYQGKTPMSSFNLNKMQNNIENTLVKVSPTEPKPKADVWLKKGKNSFNKNHIVKNYYIKDEDGSISEYDSNMCYCFDYIEVSPNAQYTMSNATATILLIAEYDENKNFIKQNRQNDTNNFLTITTSETTKYIRISMSVIQINTIQFEVGEKTEYEAYIEPEVYVKNNNNEYILFKEEKSINVTTGVEFKTGRIIDGKEEYSKRCPFGSLPNSTIKGVQFLDPNDKILKAEGIAVSQTETSHYFAIPNSKIQIDIENGWINITTETNMSTYNAFVDLYYTKN